MKTNYLHKLLMTAILMIALAGQTRTLKAEEPVQEETKSHETGATEEPVEDTTEVREALEQSLIEAQNIYDSKELIQASHKELGEAIEIAEALLADENTPLKELEAGNKNLQSVMAGVERPGDKTALSILVEEASKIDRKKLTEESEMKLSDALLYAQTIFDSEEARQTDLDDASVLLKEVLDTLETIPVPDKVNTVALEKLIKKADLIDLSSKTEESKASFLDALEEAKFILTLEEIDQALVDQAYDKLEKAQGALKSVVLDEEDVLDEDRLHDKDIIGEPEGVEEDVLPSTGLSSLTHVMSQSMVLMGSGLLIMDRKKKK